jgi:hypothetical protein
MKTGKKIIIMLTLLCATLFADEQKVAVYVLSDMGADEKKALGAKIQHYLVNSGKFKAIENENAFFSQIHEPADNSKISDAGRQSGASHVCVVDVTQVFGFYQISARLINLETATVTNMGVVYNQLKTEEEFDLVSDEAVAIMFGIKWQPRQVEQAKEEKPEKISRYGARASLNLNNTALSKNYKPDIGMGFGAGLLKRIPIAKVLNNIPDIDLYITPEVNLLYRRLWSDVGYESEFAISVPVMAQYYIPVEKTVYIATGIQLDIPFASTYTESGNTYDIENRKFFDFGFVMGIGCNINPNLVVDLRAVFGLTSISGETGDKSSFDQWSVGIATMF